MKFTKLEVLEMILNREDGCCGVTCFHECPFYGFFAPIKECWVQSTYFPVLYRYYKQQGIDSSSELDKSEIIEKLKELIRRDIVNAK